MRIIGGKARGRRLKAPKGRALRPTGGRVKEALFDILPHDLTGRRILDLFAGTGALSLEALSRGASEALLVDLSRGAAKAIRENLESLGFKGRSNVWGAPALHAIRRLARKEESFDVIFLDPPYEKGKVGETLRALGNAGILRPDGVVVVEHSIREPVARQFGALVLTDRRRYGTTVLSFFTARDESAGVEENEWGEST
jgi:16S rRNA (guanine(966)-N(2))-methyltransferase RsmD